MSTELIVTVATAAISAAASVIAAVIQARGKVDARREEADREPRRRSLTARITGKIDFGEAPAGRQGVDGVWLVVAIVLVLESIVLGARDVERAAEFSAGLNAVILIPAVTFVLALARPVGWGYAAGTVTALHGAVFIVTMALSGGRLEGSPQVFILSFIANALLVGGVAFLRTRAKPAALGGTLVAFGVAALAWLFVPMLAPGREPVHPPPDPHGFEGEVDPGLYRDRPDEDMRSRFERPREPRETQYHQMEEPARNFGRDTLIFAPRVRDEVERVEPRRPGEWE